MFSIQFCNYLEKAKYEEKGKPVEGYVQKCAEVVIRDKKGIVEVIAGAAPVVLRTIYQRFTSFSLSLFKADEIIEDLYEG